MGTPERMELFCLKNTNISKLSEEGETKDEAQKNITKGLELWTRGLDLMLTATDTMSDLRARRGMIMLHNLLSSEGMWKVVTASCTQNASLKALC